MTGGAGDDVLNGGVGSDTYVWRKGDGADTIFDRSGQSAQTDTLSLADVASTGVTLTRHRGDLLLTVNATGETITVANQFLAPAFRGGLESIRFSDGVSWTFDDILAHTIVNGSAASETLAGTAFADTINGLAGDDTINGYAGDDRLTGGAGKDVLSGGAGSDTYVWRKGDGADTIIERFGWGAQTDTLSLADVASTGVTLTRSGADLRLTVNATGETITITNQFSWSAFGYGLESIRFSDGVSWTPDDILAHTVNGSAASETGRDEWFSAPSASWPDMLALDAAFGAAPVDPITDFSMAEENIRLAQSAFANDGQAGGISSDAFGSGAAPALTDYLLSGAVGWTRTANVDRLG